MAISGAIRVPCRQSWFGTGRGPVALSHEGGSSGLTSAGRSSSTIHGRVLTPSRTAKSSDRSHPTSTSQQDCVTSSHGFGISFFPHFAPTTSDKAYVKALSASALKTYDESLSGCVDRAQRTTDKEYGIAEANSEWARVDGNIQRDARYQLALRSWRTCAAAAGHPAESRLSLIESLRKQYISVMAGIQGDKPELPQDQLAALAAKNPD